MTFVWTHVTCCIRRHRLSIHCSTPQHTVTHHGVLLCVSVVLSFHNTTLCKTLHHTAPHCTTLHHTTGWRRLIGSPKLQIVFHKRATNYRSLLWKMTYKDKGSYESSPPCIPCFPILPLVSRINKIIGLFCKRAL